MGAKLVSGRVEKISSANVSADRYQFLSLSEAEPDFGLPSSNGQVLASNTSGGRYFVTLNTDNVTEANNLYYTNARVQSHLDAAGYQTAANILANVVTVMDLSGNTTTDLAEGNNLYYTNARVGSYLAQNDISVQSLVVQGNLTVQGTTTTLNTDVLIIEDKNIILANGAINASVADGAGITIDGAQANIVYRESGDKFEINKNLDVTGNIIAGSGGGGSITGANLVSANNVVATEISTGAIYNTGYINFGSDSYIGDEPGFDPPALRVVAAANLGLSFETDADISGNNNVATFSTSGEFAVPKSLVSNSLVSNSLVLTGSATVNGNEVLTKELTDATSEPTGHESRTDSTISFNANTRVFSIQPTGASYNVWVKGNKFVKTTTDTVTLPNVTDLYYIYFDPAGNLATRTSYFDWANDAPTSYVYFNANTQAAVFLADERHGIVLDWQTHEYLHRTRGAVIAQGFSISDYTLNNDGSSDANAQISIGNGTFFDEDLQVDIVHSNTPTPNTWEQDLQGPARIPMFYLSGTSWVRDEPTDFPLKQGTSRIKYNLLSGGQWSTPDVPVDGNFTTSWIIATNNLNYPILAIMGQSASDTIGQEEAKNFQDLTLTDFPVIEFRPLYKIIWNTNTGFANTPKAVISKVYDLRNIISASPSAAIASDHGLLSGLGDDDHDQYLHTEIARTVTASHTFGGTQTFANIVVNGTLSGNISGVSSQVETLNNFTTSNLAEGNNLYYTNARVFSNVSNMSINVFADVYMENPEINDILIWDGNGFVLTAIEQATAANIANVVLSLQLNNTDELSEGNVNLYFSNALARGAFTAGKNITISPTGIINASDTTESFNLNIDGSEEYRLTDIMSEAINFNSLSSTNKVVMKSIHFTNITDELAYFSGNIVFGDGNTVIIANRIPVPEGTSIELLERNFVFSANDKVNLQGFDSAGNPTANIIDSILSYDIIEGDTSYKSVGFDITDNNAKLVINSESVYSIVESIRIVNIDTDISKANVYITDANDNVRAYLAHNLSIPPNTSVEVLHSPKRINTNNKLYVKKNSPNISVVCSYRISEVVTILSQTSQVTSGSNLSISLSTTVPDGTQIYYSIQ